ncbi:MAG: hypothetical protein Ctma_0391 [Catillopecten margaritatus gill symbiont]|uniref:Copper chaperone PCu(A)C n=1 Tax=Catillopecten margaritatus gill symbiont TaxID=3083288 RepID=A0AAU6PFA5_9GAMM
MNKIISSLTLFLLFATQASAMNHGVTGISIHNPWVRSAPANAPVLGVFMQINNKTNNAVKLLSADADGYKRVEIHRTLNDNGLMKMVKQPFAPISAGGKLQLKPGSWHIMLIKPDKVPSKGSMVAIKLEFDNGTMQTVHAEVKSGQKMPMNDNHGH